MAMAIAAAGTTSTPAAGVGPPAAAGAHRAAVSPAAPVPRAAPRKAAPRPTALPHISVGPVARVVAPAQAAVAPVALTRASTLVPAPMPDRSAAIVRTLARGGIPTVALQAYRLAAAALATSDPSCHLPWTVLAGIGRVESDHGTFGGAALRADGAETRPIFGLRLDGSRSGTAVVGDTDHGRYDGDAAYDRAVGPMQFLPGTWMAIGVDADGNGVADPQNMFDAAASAGVYLCRGRDLADPVQLWTAILSYNDSAAYVDLVLSLARQYAAGMPGIGAMPAGIRHPIAPTPTTSPTPAPTPTTSPTPAPTPT
ncbi:MAG: hypothetical protein DLM56_00285, partial [Pseudonocardiales bacterium]